MVWLRLVDYQIDQGISGLWALGSTGEDISLSRNVKYDFAAKLAEVVDDRLPVIMGSGEFSVEDNIDFYRHCKTCGINKVSYIHRDTKQGNDQYVHVAQKIADGSPLPVYLYNNVQRGKEIDFGSLSALSGHNNIVGAKYGARLHMSFIRAASLNKPTFQILSAGNFFFSALCYGLSASTTSDANFIPRVYVKIKSLFDSGKLEEARKLQQDTINLLQLIPRTDNGESSSEIKFILSEMDICLDNVNPSYRKLTDIEKQKIRSIMPLLLEANKI